MSYTLFMARRLYSQGGGSKRVSRTAVVIATAGVALGLAIMIIAVSVVLGFKREVRNKVTGIGSHIQVLNYESLYNPESKPLQISDSLVHDLRKIRGVKNVQQFCLKTGMLKTDEAFQGVAFRGIDEDYDLSFLRSCLVEGEIAEPFTKDRSTGRLVISQRLASQLNLQVGSRVYAYFFDQKLRARRFTVEAIYATNMSEYDKTLVFCDYHTSHQLLGFEDDQSSGAEIVINEFDSLAYVSSHVLSAVGHRQDAYGAYFSSPTIKELYPGIFSWLDLLDMNVVVILLLMMAVAGFTTVSGLLIIILERTQFIGVMKAMGAQNRSLRHLFIYYSLLIVIRGMLIGDILAIALCLTQQHWGFVRLDASTYYVDTVPVLMNWTLILFINLAVFLLSALALLLPSYLVSRIQPARSIRFE